MSKHNIVKCRCGNIIAQCRCPGEKEIEWRKSCEKCMDKKIDVTILIKTFERPDALTRLLRSVRHYYPYVAVVVVDDSRQPCFTIQQAEHEFNINYLHTSFDIGLAAGRNLGMKHVQTKYVFICDDDCEFTEKTDLQKAVDILEKVSCGDILGVEAAGVHYHGKFSIAQSDVGTTVEYFEPEVWVSTLSIGGALECDFVPNIFIAKTASLRACPWDESLKMGEHFAFFYTYLGQLKVAYTRDVRINHGGMPRSEFYSQHRGRAQKYVEDFMRKAGIKKRIDLHGSVIEV